jgi:hypothetical protein
VAADGALIDRLLAGVVPGTLRDRMAEGVVDLIETYPSVTAVRCMVRSDLRPTADDADRVRSMTGLLARFEALTPGPRDLCLWRPDGCLLLIGEGSARAAGLILQVRTGLDGQAGFGVHTGAAVGGMLGRDRPRFEVWGEAVDVAESLARLAAPGEVLVAPTTESELRDSHALEPRGVREVGGTQMRVHALVGVAGG